MSYKHLRKTRFGLVIKGKLAQTLSGLVTYREISCNGFSKKRVINILVPIKIQREASLDADASL